MKKFLVSILLGLALGIVYVGLLVAAFLPLILLFKSGLLGLVGGSINPTDFLKNVLGLNTGLMYKLDVSSLIIIVMQLALYAAISVCTFMFMSKVLAVHLSADGGNYFQGFYNFIFAVLLFVPELLIILSVFFRLPLYKSLIGVGIVAGLIFIFATITAFRVLPDVVKNEEVHDIFEE